MKEEDYQRKVLVPALDQFQAMGKLNYFHVPNGGYRRKAEAGILRAMGVKRGVPDLIILATVGSDPFTGFIEVKRPWKKGDKRARGRLSPDQESWRDTLKGMGFEWVLVESIDDMLNALNQWGIISKKEK